MLKLVQCLLFALIVSTDCDHEYGQQQCKSGKLIVDTSTGKVKGKIQHTFFHGTKYISFIGIPYAEPPTGNLRFRVIINIHRDAYLSNEGFKHLLS